MRIGIDARLWNQTGVGRYIRNIIVELHKIDHKNNYFLFILKEDKKDVEKKINGKNWKLVETNIKWHSFKEQIKFPSIIKKQKVDLMHFPYIDIPLMYRGSFVITIHDLIYHHFMTGKASTQPFWLYGFKMLSYRFVINNAARKAKKIISVSNSTKEEIFDHLLVNKRKVEVIYEGADDFSNKKNIEPEIKNYFLYVGNVYPHKNADKFVKAFETINKESDCKLVFVGKDDYFYSRLKKSISSLIKNKKVIFKFEISDEELFGLYKNSIALVRPSLMEGFSLPPLEAMKSDCLVLASDIPVHKEILKDNVIYFNPNDHIDLANKMHYVLNLERGKKQKLIEKGKELVKDYSWEKAAKEHLKIYESSLT